MPDDDITHFPKKYGENYLYLLDIDPTHIHAFWEIIPDEVPGQILKKSLHNPDLCLKIYCDFRNQNHISFDLHVHGLINDWFIELERPTVRCYAELGYNDPGKGEFVSICRSNDLNITSEKEFLENPINKKNKNKKFPLAHQKKRNYSNPFHLDRKEERISHHMEYITDNDIKAYYSKLAEKRASNPEFSPWKSILERMYSAEVLRAIWLSELSNLYIQNFSSLENHSSYWSAASSYSSIFKIDKDK